jgi:hypothetical protein
MADNAPVSTLEWRSVVDGRHNLLLEGPHEWADALLKRLTPFLERQILRAAAPRLGALPPSDGGVLILLDVAALHRDDQLTLFRWLDDGGQVVSTTATPLFPLVVEGGFDEALYYRLNVIRLHSLVAGTAVQLPAAAMAMAEGTDSR